jgi:hypothetical protein
MGTQIRQPEVCQKLLDFPQYGGRLPSQGKTGWPFMAHRPELDDAAITNLLFPVKDKSVPAKRWMPDMAYL